jgi:flavin reductase (DIM6/NTAB) family NADH-FMN oxidoreductase RutF
MSTLDPRPAGRFAPGRTDPAAGTRGKDKVPFPPDRGFWRPSPLIGQVTLVTTLNADGVSNLAPKSLLSMMSFDPPIIALGCAFAHWTAINILRDREWVVNIPGDDLAAIAWRSHALPHPRPVEAAGLTALPAGRVRPPRIEECRAHLECTLDRHLAYGDAVVFLGRVVAASLDKSIADSQDPYAALRLFGFLEDETYGVVERAVRLSSP